MQKHPQTKPHPKPKPAGKKLTDEIEKIIRVTEGQNEALKLIIDHNSKKHTDEK
ncbi:MAG TPA: hypothetical protein VFC92_02930 [Bacteroidales bacterium]|nr:hypothetical protein [Bacteroidales bacterium]